MSTFTKVQDEIAAAVTLAQGLQNYLRTVSILKKGYEQERYRITQLCRSFLGRKLVHEITSVDIATYRDKRLQSINKKTGKTISNATVRLEMSLLSNFFDLARIEWGYTKRPNPCADVRKPKIPPGRDRRLTAREERRILRYAHEHKNKELYSIIVLALSTAMRQGEILTLRWEHINFKTRVAHLPETKNGTKRDIPLSTKAREALMRLEVKTAGPVFTYSKHGFKSTWRFMVKRLGIEDLHFHDLRHEAVSRLFELGTLDMMEIAAISGHRSLAMLKRYTHLKANRLVNKLEGTRSRGRLAMLNHFIPYPGIMRPHPEGIEIVFPDFEHATVSGVGPTKEQAILRAQDALLRSLASAIRSGQPVPKPDQYLRQVNEELVVMVDPIAML